MITSNDTSHLYSVLSSSAKLLISFSFTKKSKSLMKMLNEIGPNTDPCGTPNKSSSQSLNMGPYFSCLQDNYSNVLIAPCSTADPVSLMLFWYISYAYFSLKTAVNGPLVTKNNYLQNNLFKNFCDFVRFFRPFLTNFDFVAFFRLKMAENGPKNDLIKKNILLSRSAIL